MRFGYIGGVWLLRTALQAPCFQGAFFWLSGKIVGGDKMVSLAAAPPTLCQKRKGWVPRRVGVIRKVLVPRRVGVIERVMRKVGVTRSSLLFVRSVSFVLWIWLLAGGEGARALDPGRGLNGYGHQVWRTDSGLPQNTVHALLQSRDGYVWVGTDGGLVRFDGVDFAVFDVENTPQFRSNTVYDLLEDQAGTVWISTAAGLLSYHRGAFAAYSTGEGLPSDTVWFSYQDSRRRLWAMTAAGPAWLDGKSFKAVSGAQGASPVSRQQMAEDGEGKLWLGGSSGVYGLTLDSPAPRVAVHLLSGQQVSAVVVDGVRQVWMGTADGLKRYGQGALTAIALGAAGGKGAITALLAEPGGDVWAGTAEGLLLINDLQGSAMPRNRGREALAVKRVDRLFRDRQGALWMGTERGVFRLRAGQVESFAAGSELAGSHVLAMLEDREGGLWLGTESGGLNLLRDQKFTTYTTQDGLSGNFVRCVFQDAQGALWIGTDGAGLNRRTTDGFAHLTTADGLSSNVILSLAGGTNGDLWVGTPDGLNRVHSAGQGWTIEHFGLADGLPDDFIRSLYSDRDGSLWIGTRHGLAHRVGGKFLSFSRLDGLGSDVIGAIVRAGQGGGQGGGQDLWIATSAGISRLRQGVFRNYAAGQGLGNNVVTAIAQSGADGALWLGTNGGGLSRLRDAGEQTIIEPVRVQGLPGTIYGILEDGSGRLWLSAQSGIYRVSVAQLNGFLGGNPAWPAVALYGTADGMNIREGSGGGHPAAWKLNDGSLWFSTLDGVSVIDPARAPENEVPPPVVIEKLLVDDQVRDGDQMLTIPPGTHRLEVHYAGLSFVAPQKVQYRYRLEGLDSSWIEAGSRRAAFYTNLSPGRYRFRVLAANNDGVWNSVGASVGLRLLPHYYQTGWFYAALLLAGIGLGYLGYRWRVGEVEARFGAVLAERGRIAREIHDTLAQGFVGISVQLELVARLLGGSRDKGQEAALEHLDHARALVRDSLEAARSSIWDLRSTAAADLPARLTQSANRIARGSGSKVYLQVKGTYRALQRKTEEELLRIAEEAVANAVRHGAAPRIEVQLLYEATRMSLQVADDGRGFTPLPGALGPEGHFGLRGMHERAGQIGAALRVESAPGHGTKVSVETPLTGTGKG